jgi:hypothetical protein
MMADVTISCPHCRRQYTMKIDPERLQRLKTRATCGRCGNTFDVASRITPPSEATTEPKLPRYEAPPAASQLVPSSMKPSGNTPASGTTMPDLRDEMEELAREFAEAAARFTPVGVKRPAEVAEPPPAKPAVEEPTNPGLKPASLSAPTDPALTIPPAAAAMPTLSEIAAAVDALSLDAEPAGEEEFTTTVPTLSRVAAAPKSWLDVADPGLAGLQSPPSAGAAALESLLHESDTIALPSPPAAS